MCAFSGRSWTPSQKERFSHRLPGREGNTDTTREDNNLTLEITKFTFVAAKNYD